MHEQLDRHDEARLEALFSNFGPPLADDGFTASVMKRVQRQMWIRRLVFVAATVMAGALALGPLTQFSLDLGEALVTVATRWNDVGWLADNQALIMAALLASLVPPAIRWLEN